MEQAVDRLFNYIRENSIPPVMARDIHAARPIDLFNNLNQPVEFEEAREHHQFIVMGRCKGDNYVLTPELIPRGEDGGDHLKKLILISSEDDYVNVDRITDYYQEEHRLRAYNSNRSIDGVRASPDYMWRKCDNILRRWLREAVNRYSIDHDIFNIDYHDPDFLAQVQQSLFDDRVHVSQYRATWVVAIINFFRRYINIHNVLDPSMGWGDRLIGAIKCGVNYDGFDPHIKLHSGYSRIIKDLVFSSDFSYNCHATGFEDANIQPGYYDFILTSPPYGDLEIYTRDKTQSIVKFKSHWLDQFYRPYLLKSWSALRPGGIIVLQVGDYHKMKMVNFTIKAFEEIQDASRWGQFLTYNGEGKYPNLHLVYRKRGRGYKDSI